MKIELNEVRIKNFLSFGAKWQKVPLLKGMNIITGWDEDTGKSNGAGKCVAFKTLISIECSEEIEKILKSYK